MLVQNSPQFEKNAQVINGFCLKKIYLLRFTFVSIIPEFKVMGFKLSPKTHFTHILMNFIKLLRDIRYIHAYSNESSCEYTNGACMQI
jgi:hypothetical protein